MIGWALLVGLAVVIVTSVLSVWFASKRKQSLIVNVTIKQKGEFTKVLKDRKRHVTKYLSSEQFSKPLLPDTLKAIQHTNKWETVLDKNPTFTDKNCVTLAEYLAALTIENANARQAIVETLLNKFQHSFIKMGIPFPLTWFLPGMFKKGGIPLHPLQITQLTLLTTSGLLTTIADAKNFIDRELILMHKKRTPPAAVSFRAKLPSRCVLVDVFEYYQLEEAAAHKLKAVSSNIFPGLYKGFAPHNKKAFEGQHALRNQIFTEICNRLSKNFAVAANIESPVNGEGVFTLVMPDGTEIERIDDFVAYLIDNGCTVSTHIRVASAVMGFSYSLKKKTVGQHSKNGEKFYDVPFSFFSRTGVRSTKYNAEAIMPLLHSGLNLVCQGNLKGFGEISFQIQYYMLLGHHIRWNHRNDAQDLISWNPGKIVDEWTERDDVVRIVRLAAWYATIMNGVGLKQNLYSCGYGVLGVCSDSVAAIQYVLRGRTDLYPILALGEFRITSIKEITELQKMIDHHETKLGCSEKDIDDLQALKTAIRKTPNDNYLDPEWYNDTLRRIDASLPWEEGHEPFASAVVARKIIKAELEANAIPQE